uniref:Uncharacterized protein n=1 Tax=Timema genevievae TaxID=629358 RepID=A0A7R9JXF8_TIMGE|nr:unnamed protein product [Timema genevievae]
MVVVTEEGDSKICRLVSVKLLEGDSGPRVPEMRPQGAPRRERERQRAAWRRASSMPRLLSSPECEVSTSRDATPATSWAPLGQQCRRTLQKIALFVWGLVPTRRFGNHGKNYR